MGRVTNLQTTTSSTCLTRNYSWRWFEQCINCNMQTRTFCWGWATSSNWSSTSRSKHGWNQKDGIQCYFLTINLWSSNAWKIFWGTPRIWALSYLDVIRACWSNLRKEWSTWQLLQTTWYSYGSSSMGTITSCGNETYRFLTPTTSAIRILESIWCNYALNRQQMGRTSKMRW